MPNRFAVAMLQIIQLNHLFSLIYLGLCALGAFCAPEVTVGSTVLTGRDIKGLQSDVEFFGGIPYAEPPIGTLRLRPPVQKFTLNESTFDASQYGLACLQPNVSLELISEDCLTLNIIRPAGIDANASLPVIFWSFGGGFRTGSSFVHNGSQIVAQSVFRGTPVIWVSFNYRLSVLGFPQGQEAADEGALNLALLDQLTALQWVQKNIRAFGGDREKVTTMGGSAGAIMTSILYLNNTISGLSRAGIFLSGGAASAGLNQPQDAQSNWVDFVSHIPECALLASTPHTFSCVQSVTNSTVILQAMIQALNDASPLVQNPFKPTIDGPGGLIPELSSVLGDSGRFAKLPFIWGDDMDQGTRFTPNTTLLTLGGITLEQAFIQENLPPAEGVTLVDLTVAVGKVLELYPEDPAQGSPFGTGDETFGMSPAYKRAAAIIGDINFQSQRRYWSKRASSADVNVYGYQFSQNQPNLDPALGVAHGSAVTFVYGEQLDTSEASQNLTRMMIDYWVSFATSLDPNDSLGMKRPTWTAYTPEDEVIMQFKIDNTTIIRDDYRKGQMDYINSQLAVWHH